MNPRPQRIPGLTAGASICRPSNAACCARRVGVLRASGVVRPTFMSAPKEILLECAEHNQTSMIVDPHLKENKMIRGTSRSFFVGILTLILLMPSAVWAEGPLVQLRPVFREAEEFRPEKGTPVLLNACQYFEPDADGNLIRKLAYNCAFPGPEIHVLPGRQLEVTVANDLDHLSVEDLENFKPKVVGGQDSPDVKEFISKQSGVTNFHTHGFHVSPSGRSDNVMLKIKKDRYNTYTYNLPKDHAPGTHWYHAHLHGSTAVQVQGGMAGALIVDPPAPEFSLNPPGYSVNERVMVMQFGSGDAINPEARTKSLEGVSGLKSLSVEGQELVDVESVDGLRNLVNRLDDDEMQQLLDSIQEMRVDLPLLTINGLEKPVARVQQDRQVQRLRLINAGSRRSDYKTLWIEGHKMYLAAFDGINLTELPRDASGQFIAYDEENPLQMAPGNRADVYFLPEEEGSYALMMASEIGLEGQGPGDARKAAREGGAAMGAAAEKGSDLEGVRVRFERELMTFEVSGAPASAFAKEAGIAVDLEAFLVDLNEHLQGLQKLPPYSDGYLRPFTDGDYIQRHMTFNIDNPPGKDRSFTINDRDYNKMVDGHMEGMHDYLGRVEGDGGRGPQGQTPWPLRTNTQEEWTIENKSSVRHPFHIHVSPFWVTSIREEMCVGGGSVNRCGVDPTNMDNCVCEDGQKAQVEDVREYFPDDPRLDRWQDTVNLPAKGGSVTFRHRVGEFTGLYVVHCHILQHEDRGMMINILTVPNEDTNPQGFFERQQKENERINKEING